MHIHGDGGLSVGCNELVVEDLSILQTGHENECWRDCRKEGYGNKPISLLARRHPLLLQSYGSKLMVITISASSLPLLVVLCMHVSQKL